MNRASLAAITALALGGLAAPTAHAQNAPAGPNGSAADAALAEGRRLYDLQEWDKAIAKFKEAYTLREDAPALFNIAQSYRLKNDCANALAFYKTFKRKFPATTPEKVDKFIADMDACAKTGPATPPPQITTTTPPDKLTIPVVPPTTTTTTTTTPPTTTSASQAEPPQAAASDGHGMRTASYVLFGVGGAGIVSGVVFGLLAKGKASDAEDPSTKNGAPKWDPSVQSAGRRDNKIAIASFAVGGAAVIGGAVLFVLSGKKSTESSSMTFVPADGGGTMVYGGRF